MDEQPDVCEDHGASARSPLPGPENPVWAVDQGSQRSAMQAASAEPPVHIARRGLRNKGPEGDQRSKEHPGEREGDGGGGRDVKFAEELEITAGGYTCVVMATALTDKLVKAEAEPALSHQGAGQGAESEQGAEPEHAELFDSQGLQTMIDGCQIQGQRSSLDGPQVTDNIASLKGPFSPRGVQVDRSFRSLVTSQMALSKCMLVDQMKWLRW